MNMRIDSVKIVMDIDEYVDLSWLGEYTDNIPDSIDLKRGNAIKRDRYNNRQYKYFICANRVEDRVKDLSKRGYSKGVAEEMARARNFQDYNTMEKISNGEICHFYITAHADISYPVNEFSGDRRIETLQSGGLSGVESNSGDYIKTVAKEELADLKDHLKRFGVPTRKFNAMADSAIDNIDL